MRSPKLFIFFIFFAALALFLIDLPTPIYLKTPKFKIGRKEIGSVSFRLNPNAIKIKIGSFSLIKNLSYRLGLDLEGGTRIVYSLDTSQIKEEEKKAAHEAARNVVERRVNFFGVVEPTIQMLKVGSDYRLVVELPGVTNVNDAIDLIGKTSELSFWEEAATKEASLDSGAISQEAKEATSSSSSSLPLGITSLFPDGSVKTNLTGKDLKTARVAFDPNTGKPQVQLNFTSEGAKEFANITQKNTGRILAIVLDDQVIESPRVNEPILTGDAVISGDFTTIQAKKLAINLNSGALPVPLDIISMTNIGPSLGFESLKKSVLGGVLGFVSVIIFMIFLYRKEGFLASLALFFYVFLVLFIFKMIPVTLTLAGIAGFILSIGMALDANILIFERMKEEKRAGRQKDLAIDIGFKRAWTSIRDSNVSSLITCFILYYFGSGIVRGFAFALAIGILVSMFSAITITRSLLRIFGTEHKLK